MHEPHDPSARRRLLLQAGASLMPAGLTGAGRAANAQGSSTAGWPARPVRLVVNGAGGGSTDVSARILGEALGNALGKPFVVDIKAGGSGTIGAMEALKSPPDGHTFLMSIGAVMTEVPHSVKMPFDPLKDFRAVAELWHGPLLLIGNNQVPAKTFPELLAWIKAQPKGVSIANYSAGTASHLMGVVLAREAGIELNHVSYRGAPPATTDLIAGQLPLMFTGLSVSYAQLKAGAVRPYAVAASKRSELLPDVPTFAELGYPKVEGGSWMALWTQPQVPTAIQERLRQEIDKALARPDVVERFRNMGTLPGRGANADGLARAIAREYEQTGALLRSIGYKPE